MIRMLSTLFYTALALTFLDNVAGIQENCRMDSASRNSPLSGTFKSRKEGAIYTCTCDPSDDQCGSYQCLKDTEDEEEGIGGEPVGESGSSLSEGQTVQITVIEPTSAPLDDCRDSNTGASYKAGQKFTKIGNDGQQTCTCNDDGTITCKGPLKTCPLPRSPEPNYDPTFVPPRYGCYDPWGQRWYRNYQSWDRKRLMNSAEDEELFGTYRCSCSMGVTQCSARDIPCCDRQTGKFVGGGERFFTSMSGTNYICTCRMQRGRFSDCLPESFANKQPGSTSVPSSSGGRTNSNRYRPAVPSYGASVGQVQCRDRYRPGTSYSHGQSWIQWRNNGGKREPWTCKCVVSGSSARTQCKMNNY